MRTLLLVFLTLCMALMATLHGTAQVDPASIGQVTNEDDQSSPYPAIQAWATVYDRAVIGCLVDLAQSYNHRLDIPDALKLVDDILYASIKHDLDPLLIASVIAAESSFYARARSRCGAEGLMQLTRGIQPWVGVDDPYNTRQNVSGGCQYLNYLKTRFSRLELILAAYNAGPNRVAHLGRVPKIPETVRYVRNVTSLHARLAARVRARSIFVAKGSVEDPFVLA